MNRYEFEDKISDYLDNQLSISERRKFESFLDKDSEARDLLKSVRKTIDLLDTSWPQKASEEFLPNLLKRIEAEKSNIRIKSQTNEKTLLFGFSPSNAFLLSTALVCFIAISVNIFPDLTGSSQSSIVNEINQKTDLNQSTQVANDESPAFDADSSDSTGLPGSTIKLNDKIKLVKNQR